MRFELYQIVAGGCQYFYSESPEYSQVKLERSVLLKDARSGNQPDLIACSIYVVLYASDGGEELDRKIIDTIYV